MVSVGRDGKLSEGRGWRRFNILSTVWRHLAVLRVWERTAVKCKKAFSKSITLTTRSSLPPSRFRALDNNEDKTKDISCNNLPQSEVNLRWGKRGFWLIVWCHRPLYTITSNIPSYYTILSLLTVLATLLLTLRFIAEQISLLSVAFTFISFINCFINIYWNPVYEKQNFLFENSSLRVGKNMGQIGQPTEAVNLKFPEKKICLTIVTNFTSVNFSRFRSNNSAIKYLKIIFYKLSNNFT